MFFESLAHAMGAPQGGAPAGPTEMLVQFAPLVLMIAVFWFLLIRPQKKRQQEHKKMLDGLRRGELVMTSGGFFGRIIDIDGDIITVDLGETKVRIGRGFITGLVDAKLQSAFKEGKKGKASSSEDRAPKEIEKRDAGDDSDSSEK